MSVLSSEDEYYRKPTKYKWSSQFGLYRYTSDDENCRHVLNNRKNIRYFALIGLLGFGMILVCFIIYEKTSRSDSIKLKKTSFENSTDSNDVVEARVDLINFLNETSDEDTYFQTSDENIDTHEINDTSSEQTPLDLPLNQAPVSKKLFQNRPSLDSPSTFSHRHNMGRVRNPRINLNTGEILPKSIAKRNKQIYVDEHVGYIEPPDNLFDLDEYNTNANRRQLLLDSSAEPKPFQFSSSGPRPRAFSLPNIERKSQYPQLSNYRYPLNAHSIQDIIQYLSHDKDEKSKEDTSGKETIHRVKFTGKYRNPHINRYINKILRTRKKHKNKHNSLYNEHQYYPDPFLNYRPLNPSDINLLATHKFRFAPTLSQTNHQSIPLLEEDFNTEHLPTKTNRPLSVLLDIYPMVSQGEEHLNFPIRTTKKPPLPKIQSHSFGEQDFDNVDLSNPGNNYNNLNSLYHLSNYPPNKNNKNANRMKYQNFGSNNNLYNNPTFVDPNFYDVTGYQFYGTPNHNTQNDFSEPPPNRKTKFQKKSKPDPQKMVVHLNLYPRKKTQRNDDEYEFEIPYVNRNLNIHDKEHEYDETNITYNKLNISNVELYDRDNKQLNNTECEYIKKLFMETMNQSNNLNKIMKQLEKQRSISLPLNLTNLEGIDLKQKKISDLLLGKFDVGTNELETRYNFQVILKNNETTNQTRYNSGERNDMSSKIYIYAPEIFKGYNQNKTPKQELDTTHVNNYNTNIKPDTKNNLVNKNVINTNDFSNDQGYFYTKPDNQFNYNQNTFNTEMSNVHEDNIQSQHEFKPIIVPNFDENYQFYQKSVPVTIEENIHELNDSKYKNIFKNDLHGRQFSIDRSDTAYDAYHNHKTNIDNEFPLLKDSIDIQNIKSNITHLQSIESLFKLDQNSKVKES